ncbi:MAG: glycosyltransferase family 39 protein [Pseudomonadota bacterium]
MLARLAGPGGWCIVFVVALVVILPGLSTLPVTDRDEARFVQASKQMIETGDLIDIRFQDAPRWKKPAGIYWLQAASASSLGGVEAPIWAYRLPSALAALATALLMIWAGTPLVGRAAAALAGVMLASTALFAAEANIAKTDATLMLTALVVLGAMARLLQARSHPGPWVAATFWIALAAAILIKGPIVPLIAILALIGCWLGAAGRPVMARFRPLWGTLLMFALILPWLIAIWIISDGAFFQESLGKDLAAKVAEGKEKHWGPPGLYSLLVWLTFWPWAALLPLALPWLWAERRAGWLVLLAAWTLPFWLILEAVPTKLPHYVLPLYPALALALAAWATAAPETPPRLLWRRISAGLVVVPALILALACIALPLVLEQRLVVGAALLAVLGAFCAILAGRAALMGARRGQIGASLIAAVFLYPATLHFALPAMQTGFASPRIAAAAAGWRACASGPLISAGYREPSLVFLTETDTLLATPAETAALLSDPGRLFVIEERWWPLIEAELTAPRPDLITRAEISYFNYNRGKTERARLLTHDDPRWQPCASATR